ncbi:MAG: hypothetical protein EOM15_02880 [Spirochaetia bacterium]|nr:hypothetical protein [Spirochaetia bacterium]
MEEYDEKTIRIRRIEKRLGEKISVYEQSQVSVGTCSLVMIRCKSRKYLVAHGNGPLFDSLEGEVQQDCKICPTNHANRKILNTYFPFTRPVANTYKKPSIGLGDRLGIATEGHIQAMKEAKAFPVFAQQSIRELSLTRRNLEQVIDSAAYSVFQEGFTLGYGADADHLKTSEEVARALEAGASMITLDSSEQIEQAVQNLSDAMVDLAYDKLDKDIRKLFEQLYEDQLFSIGDITLKLGKLQLRRDILTYHKALDHMQMIYEQHIKKTERPLDFEISIDETTHITNPKSHLFIALELKRRKISITTLAPRFFGEFQNGIDYHGDIALFEEDLVQHVAIAQEFHYRLSIHSGSDKFSIFPIFRACIQGSFHIKTSGTSWLEAVRLISQKDPQLYRKIHKHALSRFSDACAFYHVSTDIAAIRNLDTVCDAELPTYLDDDNARQLLHITYGFILEDEDERGNKLFKEELFALLGKEEEAYAALLKDHIEKHLQLLDLK